jgi:hypothetical protein
MTRLVDALKEVGQTFELFQKGEIGPCDSTPSPVQVPNLVPSSYCRVPAAGPGVEGNGLGQGAGGSPAEPVVINPTDPELQIAPTDEKVDVRAKFALKRMLKDPSMAIDAARLILGLKGKRLERVPGKPDERAPGKRLEGIFGDDLGKAVEVARDYGTERWLLVPKGEDAALVLVNEGDPLNDPPTVIFRGDTPDISKQPGRLEKALREASTTFALFQDDKLVKCASSPSAKPVSNLVPGTFCQKPCDAPRGWTKPFRCQLCGYQMRPYKKRHYTLVVGNLDIRGETNEDGVIQEEIPFDAEFGELRLIVN